MKIRNEQTKATTIKSGESTKESVLNTFHESIVVCRSRLEYLNVQGLISLSNGGVSDFRIYRGTEPLYKR
jgi:hypothetical protein